MHRNRIPSKKPLLFIDGQIFQTDAWDRGMGKYMLQTMKQLSEVAGSTLEVKVLFNTRIKTFPERFDALQYHCPNIEQLFTPLPLTKDEHASPRKYKVALDIYIEKKFNKEFDITYMITSLFSFEVFAEYPERADHKVMVFYDLIPLMKWKDLGGYFPPHMYMSRFHRVYESDKIFCISETTRKDLIKTFSIEPEKACNINGGFTSHELPPVKPVNFVVPEKYILFPTGSLPHKNNDLVFKAFKEVQDSTKDVYLVVTSKFPNKVKKKLLDICKDKVIFTQNVTDDELQYLYQHSELVLFGSKYEGLGLPVLDAVHYDKPIVASRIPVFREMSDNAFFFFNADDPTAAAQAILRALDTKNFRDKKKFYPHVIEKYTWRRVGEGVIEGIEEINDKNNIADKPKTTVKKRVAIVSLNPGISDGINRMPERVYGALKHSLSISYFFDGCGLHHSSMERPTFLDHMEVNSYNLSRLSIDMYRKFDTVFYFLDEKTLDFMISQNIMSLPGYIILDSNIDKDNIIYRAVKISSLGTLSVDISDDTAVQRISEYIIRKSEINKPNTSMQRVIKSHLPLTIKRLYLKGSIKR